MVRRAHAGLLAAVIATFAFGGAARSEIVAHHPVVAGVTWIPAGARIRRECERTANTVHYLVPCPTLLPKGMKQFPKVHGCQLTIVGAGGGRRCGGSEWRSWIVGTGEVRSRGYGALLEHLALQGAPRVVTNPARAIDGPAMFPHSRVEERGETRVGGRLMRWYFVPPATNQGSLFAGHLVLLRSLDRHPYAYGFHVLQTFAVARELDLELVRHLVSVRPRSPRLR